MKKDFFKVLLKSSKSKARLGEIKTSHGVIKTPTFVAVGTKATVKSLLPELLKQIGVQSAFVNTYHLVCSPGVETIEKTGGVHKYANLNLPLMSDSGGFQVFSLAREEKNQQRVFESTLTPIKVEGSSKSLIEKQLLKINYKKIKEQSFSSKSKTADIRGEEKPMLVKITNEEVKFRSIFDGRLIEFTPEKSIEYQMKIGADIMMAFDECIYYGASYKYTKKATERTHQWLKRCVDFFKTRQRNFLSQWGPLHPKSEKNLLPLFFKKKFQHHDFLLTSPPTKVGGSPKSLTKNQVFPFPNLNQFLYGVIQGGIFKDLRTKSAEFVCSQNVDGIAIGGVSVGETKKEMRDQVKWVADYLPEDRPVHLLGVGQVDDILDLVKYGIDSFDCVEPTRLARMGVIYQIFQVRHQVFESTSPSTKVGGFPKSLTQKLISSFFQKLDINKSSYKNNLEPVDLNCCCYVCQNFTKSYLHHLFKQRELLGYTLATYHNLYVMEGFFEIIRKMIGEGRM